tara:strand:- start:23806 stop:24870 length:1065 start_codon:yes stop_codon:yes gene_type:complete
MSEETFDKLEFVDTPEQLQESIQADLQSQPQQEQQPQEPVSSQPVEQTQTEVQNFQQESAPTGVESYEEYSDEDVESGVLGFLSERLGREVSNFDDLTPQQQETFSDERVKAIADFVETTGRSPRDWFAYQSLNPSEMDDATAVRVNLAAEYPNLAPDEINLLIKDKYKLDSDLYSEDELKLSKLQLKIDAQKAKQSIEDIRQRYNAPDPSIAPQSIVTEDWFGEMSTELDNMTGVEFDLGNGRSFTYGLDDNTRSTIKDANSRLDDYFDRYIRDDGSWDFDTLNSHRLVLENIDSIVSSAYRQGLGDGQKNLVNKAANVSVDPARRPDNQNINSVAEQLKQQLGNRGVMNVKI